MGNTKFRLSDMIPNSWFYKLKEMGGRAGGNGAGTGKRMKKAKAYYYQQQQHYASPSPSPPRTPLQKQTQNQNQTQQPVTPNRASYYISRRMELEANKPVAMDAHVTFWEPPRKSKRKPRRRQLKPIGSSPRLSNSSRCGCRVRRKPAESGSETGSSTDWSQPCCTCRVTTSPTDIIIDVTAAAKKLPPIVTKPQSPDIRPGEKQQSPAGDKKSPPKEPVHRLKTRVKSPRVLTKKTKHRKSTARRKECGGALDGFAVVKSSSDPHRDFRESMVEMIVENNIRKSKDLEELLACYLSLNSVEYHSVIVKVFEQIWFDLN